MSSLKENLERVESAIEQACRRAGRKRREVELMAVSKTYPASTIVEAAKLGMRLFGENRVQEFAAKASELGPWRANGAIAASDEPIQMHLIGHLQSNKAGKAAELFDAIDSVDSVRLAERLNDAAAALHKRMPILIEIKLSPEESKEGLEPGSDELAPPLRSPPGPSLPALSRPDDDRPVGRGGRRHARMLPLAARVAGSLGRRASAVEIRCAVDGHERRFCDCD